MLRRFDSGESDRRLILLAEESGKVDVVAKGARKAGSRLSGSSEPLVKAKFTWAVGRARRFVKGVVPLSSYPGVRADYDAMMAGMALAEVVSLALPYDAEAREFMDLMDLSLRCLGEGNRPDLVLVWGLARLLVIEGHGPDWTTCVVSGDRVLSSPAAVSVHAGGCVEGELARSYADVIWVDGETLIGLNKLSGLEEPPLKMRRVEESLRVLARFWSGLLERPLPATDGFVRGMSLGE